MVKLSRIYFITKSPLKYGGFLTPKIMKLSTQQISALASKIQLEIRNKAEKQKFTKTEEKNLRRSIIELGNLNKQITEINKEVQELRNKMAKEYGYTGYTYASADSIVNTVRLNREARYVTDIPSLSTIQNDIILEGIFTEEKDVQKFIDKLVKKYL